MDSTVSKVEASEEDHAPRHERIEVPEIQINDMFDDAFTAIARDGACMVEVAVRLQNDGLTGCTFQKAIHIKPV